MFSSATGTPLDESNVRKALNRVLDAAGLHHCGPHQLRHMFASLLLQEGAPITYVSQQLGHRDPSITLRVYAHWLPDPMNAKALDVLDDATPDGTPAAPATDDREWRNTLSASGRVVSLNFTSWNRIGDFIRRLDELKRA